MASGGYRPNGGRIRGAVSTKNKEVKKVAEILDGGKTKTKKFNTALEFAMHVINDENADQADKIRLAIAIMPYQTPKADSKLKGKKGEKEAAAKKAAGGKFGAIEAPKLVANK